jgi:predicted O-methyltransferase YrrM
MVRGGLPVAFQRPLEFLFDKQLSQPEDEAVRKVELIREKLASQTRSFEVLNRHGKALQINAAQVANTISVNREWGTFLYLCSQSFRARTILELGSCAGISGCYLASPNHCQRFITVEASSGLASLARANIGQLSEKAEVINSLFDDALDNILPTLGERIDLAYIDGHHKYETTLHYLNRLESQLNEGALIIFDDIHLSEGMRRAWREIKARQGFSHTISAGRFGLCLWSGLAATPESYDLCPYFGCLRAVSA